MNKLIVYLGLTLDGVMQAPARPDEDTRGGFIHGGWAVPYVDSVMISVASEGMSKKGGALLLGRRTYEDFYEVWPKRSDGNPFTDRLNNSKKYVASTTLEEPLAWVNSSLLKGDVPSAVASLKEKLDGDLVILGSGILVRSLMKHNLIDEYQLSVHPLVLGSGSRLFPEGGPFVSLKLVKSTITTTGVILATYRPASGKK
ncbi:MAG: dihydrofolate reductase family protein [Bacteroidetes bacterium]|jgi:dihydrofolate reductase|nr:dihydrofolate reductase family protein [Bacteroidota bacterium]